ncbi:uncharacterized protein TM35_000731150 [Trypanosoma theileri]|uniref:Mucin-associated surface protein (MASP) n=1 Tax=Trypanosoma theileri TaxID=67003 RepID=A0A1X0NFK1_9TRYP|nr:uncharacterized protein TM35_000731150 [Trypanosoma theileri]ORC83391.1 hypothetical protein TM35_000731150 [Trypanosoma theileri]
MTKAVMVRCYLLCLFTLALYCASGLVWADSPKASDALIKPSTIGVPSLVHHVIHAQEAWIVDIDEEDKVVQEDEAAKKETEKEKKSPQKTEKDLLRVVTDPAKVAVPEKVEERDGGGDSVRSGLENEKEGQVIDTKGEHGEDSPPPPAVSADPAQGDGGVNNLDSQANKDDIGEKRTDSERRELSQTSIINPLQGENAQEELNKKPERTPVTQSPSDPNGNSEVPQTPSPKPQEPSSVNPQGSIEKEHNVQSNTANTDNANTPINEGSTTTTTTTTTLPPELTNNKKGDADSSSSISSSVWVRVPLLIVVTLACILVC